MRVWLSLVVVLASSLAFAEPKTQLVIAADSEAVRVAFTEDVIAKLDACWTKAARTTAKITFEDGKATGVKLARNGDAKAAKCLTAVLQTLALADAPGRMVASVELDATPPKKVALLTSKNKKAIDQLLNKNITLEGTGPGAGAGTGVSTPAKDAPKVELGPNVQIDGALGKDEIDRTIRSRAGVFRACYQKELNRNANVRDGKVVINFKIGDDGAVQSAHIVSSTINSTEVDKCLVVNVLRLKFPAASGPTVVNYPFLFKRG